MRLLQKAADDAAAEVAAARQELTDTVRKAEGELQVALAALNLVKPPPSATPLADKLGLPPWLLDLFQSALGSIAANGLAFLLIAFGAHRARPAPQTPSRAPRKGSNTLSGPAKVHATRLGIARLCPGSAQSHPSGLP